MLTQIKLALEAIKAFFKTGSAVMIVGLVTLLLFIVFSSMCHKPTPPVVTVDKTPIQTAVIANEAAGNVDSVLNENKKDEEKTNQIVEKAKDDFHEKVSTIRDNPIKNNVQKEKEVAQARMKSLETIYYSYYQDSGTPMPPT